MDYSDIDLVLSGHKDGVNTDSRSAPPRSTKMMVEAIRFGIEQGIKPILEMIAELRQKSGAPEAKMGAPVLPSDEVMKAVKEKAYEPMKEARKINGKQARNGKVDEIKKYVLDTFFAMPR